MDRREFNKMLALGLAAGLTLPGMAPRTQAAYDIPRFGNVHLLHMTDAHAQLLPVYYREPQVNIGLHGALNKAPHLVGEALLGAYGIDPKSRESHAFTYLDFVAARPSASILLNSRRSMGALPPLSLLVKGNT